MDYLPALDGLRWFACMAVIIFHCFVDGSVFADGAHPIAARLVRNLGGVGVDVFFALSGFLITRLLLEERRKRRTVDLFAFYIRRMLRIWPAYYLAVMAGFAVAIEGGAAHSRAIGFAWSSDLWSWKLPAHLLFLGNLRTPGEVPTLIAPLWSVCVEEQFYLLFPLTFVFAKRHRPVFASVFAGLAIVWTLRLVAPEVEVAINTLRCDGLLAGALLAQFVAMEPRRVAEWFRVRSASCELAAMVGVTAMLWFPRNAVYYPSVSAAASTFLVGTIAFGNGPLAELMSLPWIRFLGGLSYCAYLFHPYAVLASWIAIGRLHISPLHAAEMRAAAAVPLTACIAYLCRITFEARFLRLKQRFART